MTDWHKRLRAWRPGRLAQNTALGTFWQGARLFLQFAYLVLITRLLGAEGYGLFAGIVALAASLSPLVGLGFGMVLVKEVSRNPNAFSGYWAKAIRAVVVSAPIMTACMFLLAYMLLPIEGYWHVVLLIAAAELVAMPFVSSGSQAYQAHEKLGRAMFNHVQMNLLRLAAIALLFIAGRDSLLDFAWAYFGATALAAALSLIQVRRAFGAPAWRQGTIGGQVREGVGFSLSVMANTAHGEIDKALLLRLGGAAATGHYSLAMRVVSAATTPLIVYILAVVPRLFREGELGISQTARLARQLLPPILLYGGLVTMGILAGAPLLPLVFGPDFSDAVPLLYWLAPLPILIGVSQLGLNTLTASGQQRSRVKFETIALISNIALNLMLIPIHGAKGAAMAMFVSQSLLVALPAIALVRHTEDHRG